MKIRYKTNKTIADYDVYVDAVFVGTLKRYRQQYNMRRVTIVSGWRATTPSNEKLFSGNGHSGSTRNEAAQVLIKHATKAIAP